MKSACLVAGEPVGDLSPDVQRKHRQLIVGRERGVVEVDRGEIRAAFGEHATDQRQVVVLNEDGGSLRRMFGDRPGESFVDRPVGRPGLAPVIIEPGLAAGVEQTVVGEPQGLVGDHVVVAALGLRIDVEQRDVEPDVGSGTVGGHRVVGLRRRHGDPAHPTQVTERSEAGDEPTAPAPGSDRPVGVLVAHRPTVGSDDDRSLEWIHQVTLRNQIVIPPLRSDDADRCRRS